jgi:ABC-type antimicrobial peptide transport system permease subunit
VKREVAAVDGEQPVSDIRLLDEIVSRDTARERFNLSLLGSMAGLALLLAAIGIYGVISYSVSQRTHEIGIRMALGATAGEMLRLIVRQGITVAGVGVVIGLIGSAILARLITTLLFGVKPFDPLVYGAVTVVLLAVAALASWIPARRAMRIDPVIALRYE